MARPQRKKYVEGEVGDAPWGSIRTRIYKGSTELQSGPKGGSSENSLSMELDTVFHEGLRDGVHSRHSLLWRGGRPLRYPSTSLAMPCRTENGKKKDSS